MEQPTLYAVEPRPTPDSVSVLHDDPAYADHFTMVYDWTWEIELSATARTIYHYLLHRCGQPKQWTVTRSEIAKMASISPRRLGRYVAELVVQGLITTEEHYKEGKPCIYRIRSKTDVERVQAFVRPAKEQGATNCPPPKRGDKTSTLGRQNVALGATKRPHYIRSLDTGLDTGLDTEVRGANAPTAAMPPTPPPADTPPDKPRRGRVRPLKECEPQVYADQQAIKAHYVAVTGQVANKWTDGDCEELARDFGAADSNATISAMWAFTWADGRYPYRRPLKLSTAHELVPAWRRGELVPEKKREKPLDWSGGGPSVRELAERKARPSTKCPECLWLNGNHDRTCTRRAAGGAS